MTVGTTNVDNSSSGDGSNRSFTFTFAVQQAEDIQVYVDDVLKTYTTHYSVDINSSEVGGTVTFVTAPAAATEVVIARTVDLTQETALPIDGAISETTLENMVDKAMMAIQQVDARAIQIEATLAASGLSLVLPTPEANKLLAWNDDADALENVDPVGDVNGPATSNANRIALWADGTGALLADGPAQVAAGRPLLDGGAGAAPAFGQLNLAGTGVTGSLPIANGGTSGTTAATAFDALSPMSALGDTIYGGASGTRTRLAGNTSATKKFLNQTGNGAASAAPSWDALVAGDVPDLNTSKLTAGTLPIARGGTNNGSLTVTLGNMLFCDGTKIDSLAVAAGQSIRFKADSTGFEAFTPSTGAGAGDVVGPATATDRTVVLWDGATGELVKDGPAISTASTILMSRGGSVDPAFVKAWGLAPGHRLSLTSNTPVTANGDVSSAGTIYWTPHLHNRMWLKYNGEWRPYETDEISLALTASSGSGYALYVYATSETAAALESQVWTNTTTRATAIARDADTGLPIKSGDATRLHVGDFLATGANVTSNARGDRSLCNVFNLVEHDLFGQDSTDSWSYATATLRAANANTTNGQGRCRFFRSTNETIVKARYESSWINNGGADTPGIGIALDSTTASFAQSGASTATSFAGTASAHYVGHPGIGEHYVQAQEKGGGVGDTFYGDNGASTVLPRSQLTGSVWC